MGEGVAQGKMGLSGDKWPYAGNVWMIGLLACRAVGYRRWPVDGIFAAGIKVVVWHTSATGRYGGSSCRRDLDNNDSETHLGMRIGEVDRSIVLIRLTSETTGSVSLRMMYPTSIIHPISCHP